MLYLYNFIITLLLIFVPFYLVGKDKEYFTIRLIFIFHLSFFLFNYFYKDYFASDSNGYIKWSLDNSYIFSLGRGTSSIVFFVKFLNFLKLNLLNIHLIFSIIGFFGIYIFYKIINDKNQHIINKVIFFVPSWHFYSSTIGKESIIVFLLSVCLFYFEKRKIILFFISASLIYLIRPNVSILFCLLIFPLCFNYFSERYYLNNKNLFRNYFLLFLFFIILLVVFNFQKIENFIIYLVEFIETRQSYFYIGRTGYEVSQLNLFQMIFYYLFMPLGFNFSKNIFYLYSGLENIFLVLYFIISLITFRFKSLKLLNLNTFLILFILFFLVLVSIVNTNLGLAMRQKWMILPFIFYIFSIYCNYFRELKK